MEVTLRSISAGGLASPDAPLVSTMLQSPSAQCNQLLRIADLQSVAIREESFVPEDAASCSHASSSVFLVAKLGYKPGEIRQPTSIQPPFSMQGQDDDADAQKQAMLRPPGLRVQVGTANLNLIISNITINTLVGTRTSLGKSELGMCSRMPFTSACVL